MKIAFRTSVLKTKKQTQLGDVFSFFIFHLVQPLPQFHCVLHYFLPIVLINLFSFILKTKNIFRKQKSNTPKLSESTWARGDNEGIQPTKYLKLTMQQLEGKHNNVDLKTINNSVIDIILVILFYFFLKAFISSTEELTLGLELMLLPICNCML